MTYFSDHDVRTGFPMNWIRIAAEKLTLFRERDTADTHLAQHIERLALSAPHVLEDIGFERDERASSAVQTVWRRGRVQVTVTHGAATVTLHVG